MDTRSSALVLHIFEGPAAGSVLKSDAAGNLLSIGRTRASKLQIKDPSVSEKHAEVSCLNGRWHLRDLGSSNGTVLNGISLSKGKCAVQCGIARVRNYD